MRFDRRTALIGGGAGVGLIVGLALWPRHLRSDLAVAKGEQSFGSFIKIGNTGKVTVAVPQVETGQGIWTGLAQIVADELGADWQSLAVEPAPLTKSYSNPLAVEQGWPKGIRITAGSTSVRAFARPLREAAATARSMLIGAAADRWNVDPNGCEAADGLVIHGGRTFTFAELAEEAADRAPPHGAPLRDDARRHLIGKPLQRLDGPAKSNGTWRFASDVRLPEMLFASVRMAPPGGRLTAVSREAISGIPGIHHVSMRQSWIAIVGDTWWAAERAMKAANPRFSGPQTAVDMRSTFEHALANVAGREWFSRGNYTSVVDGSRPLGATYYAAPSQHLELEPVTATARVSGGVVELWAPAQAPGYPDGDWTLYPMPPGDPSGRAIETDLAPVAIELARKLGRPVQVSMSQSSSQNQDRVSPGALAHMSALPGEAGITAAWSIRVATADGTSATIARISEDKPPKSLGEFALDGSVPPYSIPNLRVQAIKVGLPVQLGYMRGSPQREFTFFTESFVDELAHAAAMEPLAFRMSMLGANGRLARCLQAAARQANWDGGAAGSTMGIAGACAFGSNIGLVATASIGDDQRIRVHRLTAAVDCGRVVNRGLVEQQISGGLIWSLAQALVESPEWIAGMPRARPFGGIGMPRLGDTPEIVVEVLESSEPAGGVSGLGTLPLAPAVANAIHAGSGKRLRSLPFDLATA